MPYTDKEAARAYFRAYHVAHRDARLKYAAEYRRENPKKVAAAKRRCYERIKHDPGFLKKRRSYQVERRKTKREHVKAIEKACYIRNRSKRLAAQKALAKTIERKAREAINGAVQRGRLPRASSFKCSRCGSPAREYHHHQGYARDKWLVALPVCSICHKAIHAEYGTFTSNSI